MDLNQNIFASSYLQLHHPSEKSGGLKTFPDHDEDHQPFPTLERALSVIDTHAGEKFIKSDILGIKIYRTND